MPYRLKKSELVEDAISGVIGEQIDRAVAEIDDESVNRSKTVHQVRKRCKKIRAAARLVRGALDDEVYACENAWFRDAAQDLSEVRDVEVMVKTHDQLVERFDAEIDDGLFAPLRTFLARARDRVHNDERGINERLELFRDRITTAKKRIPELALSETGFAALAGGLKKTYKRGRSAMADAFGEASDEAFHEWRKRVKYHWYHGRLLRGAWKPVMNARRDEVDRLASILGDDHDLAVLRVTLLDAVAEVDDSWRLDAYLSFVERRRKQLRVEASPLGAKIFAEKPKRLIQRLEAYWQAWR